MSGGAGKLLVVVPMKDPAKAKTRLGAVLSGPMRANLAVDLFTATIRHVQNAGRHVAWRPVDIAAVTGSSEIAGIACTQGITVIDDNGAPTLSLAVEMAAGWAHTKGYDALCVLPGDIAAPEHEDLVQVLSHRLDKHQAVLCPSNDLGTNAFLISLPCPIRFSYGPASFLVHHRLCDAAGLHPVVLPLESLRFDVDTLLDLESLLSCNPEFRLRECRQ